jgi:hypothetical protein
MPALHRPPSPPARPAQWFVFGGWVFDITAAQKAIRDAPRVTVSLPICRGQAPTVATATPARLTMALICHRLFSPICRFPQ